MNNTTQGIDKEAFRDSWEQRQHDQIVADIGKRDANEPRAVEPEETVIGYCLEHPDAIARVDDALEGGNGFGFGAHRVVWKRIRSHWLEQGDAFDVELMMLEMEHTRFGGTSALVAVGGREAVESWRRHVAGERAFRAALGMVEGLWRKRTFLNGLGKLYLELKDDHIDVDQAIAKVGQVATQATQTRGEDESAPPSVAAHVRETIHKREEGTGQVFETGMPHIDVMGAFGAGAYCLLAGESGSGKTTLAGEMAVRLHENAGCVVAWFSCEMSRYMSAARLICTQSTLAERGSSDLDFSRNYDKRDWISEPNFIHTKRIFDALDKAGHSRRRLRRRDLMFRGADWLEGSRIHIHKPGDMSVDYIVSRSRAIQALYPDRQLLVVVDYLQKIDVPGLGRDAGEWTRTQQASDTLMKFARGSGAMVLALSQFTIKDRGRKKGMGKDGEIAVVPVPDSSSQLKSGQGPWHDADVVWVWHRPDLAQPSGVLDMQKPRFGTLLAAHYEMNGMFKFFDPSDEERPLIPGTQGQLLPSDIRSMLAAQRGDQ